MKKSVFMTEGARDKFRAVYNQILSQFPFRQKFIHTAYGQTFVLAAGQESNPPIILLHGSCSNSAFWFPEMMALSSDYAVYALDIPGEAGNSEEYRPSLDSDAFAVWMKEVLDTLGLETAAVLGNSLGGWMALKFSTAYPERVSKLVLIASAGLAEIRPQFISNAAQRQQAEGSVSIDFDVIGEHDIPKEVLDFMKLIVESYKPIQYLPVFEDRQLLRLNMPVLFVGGENDRIIDVPQSAERLSRLVPTAEIHLLTNCGHVVSNSVVCIIPFLLHDTVP
ncbi:MAG: alpha/beta fold hydrolase [Christensenellales bacterium]